LGDPGDPIKGHDGAIVRRREPERSFFRNISGFRPLADYRNDTAGEFVMTIRIASIAAVAAFGFATSALAGDGKEGTRGAFTGGDYSAFSDNYDKSGRFERMDTDKDGVISRDEQMKSDFARYDRNRDGSLDDMESDFLNKEYEEETVGGNPDGQ